MFFGNMQSFYRRNSLHNQSPNQIPTGGHSSKVYTEQGIRSRRTSRQYRRDVEEEYTRDEDQQSPVEEISRPGIPIIKIGYYNQQEALRHTDEDQANPYGTRQTHRESDNSIRLGPNRNNIIRESLRRDLERQNDDAKH